MRIIIRRLLSYQTSASPSRIKRNPQRSLDNPIHSDQIFNARLRDALRVERKRQPSSNAQAPILPPEIRQIFQNHWDKSFGVEGGEQTRLVECEVQSTTENFNSSGTSKEPNNQEQLRQRWLTSVEMLEKCVERPQ